MNWLQFGVQWLHVLLGIVWFGYAIAMYFLVGPTLAELPESQGRITNARLGEVGRHMGPLLEGIKESPDYRAAGERIRAVSRIDLGLFGIVFTCMILMRFL